MARTRFNSPSVSMVAPTILCRRSECRGAPTGASLRVPHFPGGPPGTAGSREDQDLSADNLDSEYLMTSSHRLPSREPEHLAAGSPELDLLTVLVPESRHYSLHRDHLLFRPKTTLVAAGELQIYRGRATLDARRISPDTLLRPFRGSRLRSDMWGKPGIAGGMEVPSWGREQHPPIVRLDRGLSPLSVTARLWASEHLTHLR